jgi:hypothetical protein
MNRLENILTIILLCFSLTSCGQTKTEYFKDPEFKVLAKLISFEGGDKLHSAKFKVIKCLNDSIQLKDTISVWYYNYLQPDTNIDTVLLTLNRYDRQSHLIKNNLHCIENNGKTGITKAKINYIAFDYWEGCETGKGNCKPLTFSRNSDNKNWFLIMPCGGTETAITISGQNFNKELHLFSNNCPPYLDLSNLTDGKYNANMRACGLGGTVTFNLKTTK